MISEKRTSAILLIFKGKRVQFDCFLGLDGICFGVL